VTITFLTTSDLTMVSNHNLAALAMEKVRDEASPIFGPPLKVKSPGTKFSTWMSCYPDDTRLVHMNIPGAHDAATWNYTHETQEALKDVTELAKMEVPPPDWLRCQERSILEMLEAGIRAFDLRFEQDVAHEQLVFWHGTALLSQTATVDNVMFGFYQWLDEHPTEVLFLSWMREGSHVNAAAVQRRMYNVLTSSAAKRYISPARDELGALGEVRGKIILLRRFDLDLLETSYEAVVPGIHFSPERWQDNGASIKIVYNQDRVNSSGDGTAYIEDHYGPETPPSSSLQENIDIKIVAVQSHLDAAASGQQPDGFYWSFASGKNVRHDVAITPASVAQGCKNTRGVNQHLLDYFKDKRGKRFGIVMFDFTNKPDELIPLFLSLMAPKREDDSFP
jgi:1-phosphatidylinositol phosphodiesterase